MKKENIALVDRNRFFAEIGGKPYSVRIYDDSRHFDYQEMTCGGCGNHVLTECIAKPIPPEKIAGLHFHPEVVIDKAVNGEAHFEICDHCGVWIGKRFVGTIGEMPKIYTVCQYKPLDMDITISNELAEAVELIFWDRDENICDILYELKIGNAEYLDRISSGGLTDNEHKELAEVLAESESK